MPLVKFIAPDRPAHARDARGHRPASLVSDSLVYRYDPRGVRRRPGRAAEGTFSLCTFWLVECLTRAGRTRRGPARVREDARLRQPLGLYAEEIGDAGEALGNSPGVHPPGPDLGRLGPQQGPGLALTAEPAVTADPSPVHDFLAALHARIAAQETGGEVASYIPELARADPAAFGIAIATAEGEVHVVGDTDAPFTIQSISKALALRDGPGGQRARRRARQGRRQKTTGEAFNSIRLQDGFGQPLQPDGQRRGHRHDRPAARARRPPSSSASSPPSAATPGASCGWTRRCTAPSATPGTATARSPICCATSR